MDTLRKTIRTSSEYRKSKKLWQRTKKVISCGVQTLSKQPDKFIEGQYPLYISHGYGAKVWDNHGNKFIDYPLGLGTILLGHGNKDVVNAVIDRLTHGNIFTLSNYLETELAQKIVDLIPCAEKVRFLKTGSEACSAAVKIARAYTGKMGIAYCGYHGWHDWFTCDTPKNAGIPPYAQSHIVKFEYNNIEAFERLLKNSPLEIGTVILEPYIYEAPKDGFLQQVIKVAHKYGAVVIFDEVVTGFRTLGYSAQKMFDVKPDLCCLGKAMGNGVPISVVCGKKEIMDVLEGDCFVSSTFGGDLLGISASLATIGVLEEENAIEGIWGYGEWLKADYNEIANRLQIDTKCIGFPCRTMFMFPTSDHKSLFWQECIKRGVLFGYAQFISYSHKDEEISTTLNAIFEALKVCQKHWKNPRRAIKGKPAREVFRLVVTKENNVGQFRNT
jgi:glutamate-1-semialdehyde aminotransferase